MIKYKCVEDGKKNENKNILCVKFAIVILAELLYGYNGLTRF